MIAELINKTVFKNPVIQNAFSLYIVQFATYFLPLITVPYLVRVLGPEEFGKVIFAQSVIAFLVLITNYGFNFSATRRISVNQKDDEIINKIAVSVWAAKFLLSIICLLSLILLVSLLPRLKEISNLLLILFGLVIGNMLFPTWLYQGLERMVMISIIQLFGQLFVVIGIFAFVHESQDYLLYAGLSGLGSLFTGTLGIVVAFAMFRLRLTIPKSSEIYNTLTEGWAIFISTVSISLYTLGNTLILGMFSTNTVVGYYGAGEKIVQSFVGLLQPISMAAYPRSNRLASISKLEALKWARNLLRLMGSFGLFASTVLLVGAPFIVHVLLGNDYKASIIIVRILAPMISINAIAIVWGNQIMLPFGHDKTYTFISISAGVLNILLAVFMVPRWQEIGMAISVLFSGIYIAIGMRIFLRKHHLDYVS